jgi:DNA repair photolyase
MQLSALEREAFRTSTPGAIAVREVKCSSLLHALNFRSASEYTANLYRGCTHGCTYCYAPSLIHDDRRWGYFVDAKVNAATVLKKELEQLSEKKVVFLSSASDPYQPIEARYKITRHCLEALLEHDFPLILLTRSPLVLRDTDLLRKFTWVRVGCSISSLSHKFYEPGVVSLSRRIETLRRLHELGVTTWVSMAPIVPQLLLDDVGELLKKLKASGVSCVAVGMLRFAGYEKSRKMFEERTKARLANVMSGEDETHQTVTRLVSLNGLDKTEILEWGGKSSRSKTLDNFLG